MARRRNRKQKEDTLINVVDAKEQAQDFVERNQNLIFGALLGIVLLVGGYFAYNNFVKAPKEKEAAEQMKEAQIQFERDSFALALTNPGGGFNGFLDIIEKYPGTKAGNTANYYAGISYLQLGEYEAAISYLDDFKPDDEIFPIMKYGAMGDAYSELNDFAKAERAYKKAVEVGDNEALTVYYLKKLGLFSEKQGKFAEAKKYYERIKKDYPTSNTNNEIDKYISRVAAKL